MSTGAAEHRSSCTTPFATRLFWMEARLPDLPPGPILAAAPDGSWFLAVRLEDRKSDILLMDRFE